ncbi:MAG: GGDEF domain-containing protein [Acholeplasmataceae bacterium]|nr:GGDEF domain-containing protein [Acholeplasmataceae bacterium]
MINIGIQTQLSFFSIVLLLILLFSIRKQNIRKSVMNKLYRFILWTTVGILLMDITFVFANGINTPLAKFWLPFSLVMYFILHIVIAGLWMLYAEYTINDTTKNFKKIVLWIAPIQIAVIFFSILSINGDFLFRITAGNIYERGNYFYAISIITYGLIILTMLKTIKYKDRVHKGDFYALLIFPIPPMIGGFIQLSFEGLSLIFPGVALSLMIVYIYIQSQLTNTDHLTGLSNRREYDRILSIKSQNLRKGYVMGGILIDIDDFKKINDQFLHHVGDQALIIFSNILRESVHEDDFVARTGGDEFAIIFESKSPSRLDEILEKMNEGLHEFNQKKEYPFELQVSSGGLIYNPNEHQDLNEFFKLLDKKMYDIKEQHHRG